MTPLNFPEHGISITENEAGLSVVQNGQQLYLAKNLMLSLQISNIITQAIQAGFTKLYGVNHPQAGNQTPHYICFSRPEHPMWDFLISNQHVEKNTGFVSYITVRNGHKQILDNNKIHYKPETGGGHHLLINPADLHQLMRHI